MVDSFDQLKIDTPEQIALELPLAGIGSRFLAIAIGFLIQVALYLITGLIFPVTGRALDFHISCQDPGTGDGDLCRIRHLLGYCNFRSRLEGADARQESRRIQ
jgi:hypothetical protein